MTEISQQLIKIEAELRAAMTAKKCWRCGCFQDTVGLLQRSAIVNVGLAPLLTEARHLFEPKRYDCLGCEVCWPAVAQNLAEELDPGVAAESHCAMAEPEIRQGWPPLPGDYRIMRFRAPVAVCTLNSDHLNMELASTNIEGLSIVGSLHTENLGIEHLIRNTLANPHIRFLIVCGEDTRQAIGHLPGQSLAALIQEGVDNDLRIVGAKGKRPLLKNLRFAQVEAFRRQVRLVEHIGETDATLIQRLIAVVAGDDPGPFGDAPDDSGAVPIEPVTEPQGLTLDPSGYFVVYPDRALARLVLEHYTNKGLLDHAFAAASPAALYSAVIAAGLISRLDHAAYLGRELARAEQALLNGSAYTQDRAPGSLDASTGHCTSAECDCA